MPKKLRRSVYSRADFWGIAHNGLTVESGTPTGVVTRFEYDVLGRQTKTIDPRIGATTTTYHSGKNLVHTVTAPSGTQEVYGYDGALRVETYYISNPKYGVSGDTRTYLATQYRYNTRNQKIQEWGDNSYPVEHFFDNWGRQTTMTTYATSTATFTGSGGWPSSPNNGQLTTWAFNEATGLLASKTDAQNEAVTYSPTQARQIYQRTWARGVVTTYGYSSATGELTSVSYSDGTPSLGYTYNRLGMQATVSDSTGTRTFNYNLAGTLELQDEVLASGFYGDRRITRGYSTASGSVGRYNRLSTGTAAAPHSQYSLYYEYDGVGRLNKSFTYSYTYAANSDLIASIADTASAWTQTRTYVSNRNALDTIETKWSSTSKAKFDQSHDGLGRVTASDRTGEIFDRYGSGSQGLKVTYDYNDRSEVIKENTYLGGSGQPALNGRDNLFDYDLLGNRKTTAHNSQGATYTTNELNQYTQRTVPGYFDVAGFSTETTVTVGGTAAGRNGEYYFRSHPMANTSTAAYGSIAITAGAVTENITGFVAKTPETFQYDDDGNLLSDGRWSYTYDGENRITAIQTLTVLSPSPFPNADARRLEFTNDYLGRRVRKVVRGGYNGSNYTTTVTDLKFMYDSWNLLWELDAANSMFQLRAHAWGLDLSGSLTGAGGVGGLLVTWHFDTGVVTSPAYDGNGNVVAAIDRNGGSGVTRAIFEYDAFGQTLRESGNYAASNPFRFSTKYTDTETSLAYYGLRYYSPSLGRFLNRDPSDEKGGINLYAFIANRGPNGYDYLGLSLGTRGRFDALFGESGGAAGRFSGGQSNTAGMWLSMGTVVENGGETLNGSRVAQIERTLRQNGATPEQAQALAREIARDGFAPVLERHENSVARPGTVSASPFISPATGDVVASSGTTWYSDGSIGTFGFNTPTVLSEGNSISAMRLPGSPSGLPGEWVPDPSHRHPHGERYRHPSGKYIDWHRGQAGKPGWRGKDHWHSPDAPGGEGQHLPPGAEIPDPPLLPPSNPQPQDAGYLLVGAAIVLVLVDGPLPFGDAGAAALLGAATVAK